MRASRSAQGRAVTVAVAVAVAGGEGAASEEFEEAVVSDWFEVGQCQSEREGFIGRW